jgi:hypothetical protein
VLLNERKRPKHQKNRSTLVNQRPQWQGVRHETHMCEGLGIGKMGLECYIQRRAREK